MSQFIDRVAVTMLRGRRQVREPLGPLTASISLAPVKDNTPLLVEYDFSVGWTARHFCQPGDVNRILDVVKDELRDAVYSGFRTRLRDLEIAIYSHDREAMLSAIRDLKREVFE